VTLDPSPEELEREFGGHAWKGVNALWYWRFPGLSPPLTAERGKDLTDLRNKIVVAVRNRDNGFIR